MSEKQDAITFSDGGSRGNPGNAAIGVVIYEKSEDGLKKHVFDVKEYIGIQTNNFAEYSALIAGLKKTKALGYSNVDCFLDSELVVKQLNGLYRVKEETLKPMFAEVKALQKMFGKVTFNHVPREKNAAADKLVNEALDEHAGI